MKRRTLLSALGSAGLSWHSLAASDSAAPGATASTGQRVLVIGAGWAGLSAAKALRQIAPELNLTLIDREPQLRSLPLSNPWLVGRTPERLARVDLATLASGLGYRFVQAQVQSIERTLRQVHTSQGRFDYDWLLLAAGVDYDYKAWLGDDARAIAHMRAHFPAGFLASELDLLKNKLENFRTGDLVMTIPPAPYRCPPAPYERALLIAWLLKSRHIAGRLTVLDAAAGPPRLTRLFAERYAQQIVYRPHTSGLVIDPFARKLSSDDGEMRFDHAIFLPPMRANKLVEQAGLLGSNAQEQNTAWAEVDPLRLVAPQDARVFLAGDLLGHVSPLFGYYPKTAHMATRLGALAALQIVASSRGFTPAPMVLPESICHVWLDADPAEQLRIEAHYRLRGDGIITQVVRQFDNPQPRDEDVEWGRNLYAQSLGVPL